jgi:saccharopine dehydrogenase-like NADP-dependent oxidoreductase
MLFNICLFGYGLIGRTIDAYLRDLQIYNVDVFDKNKINLNEKNKPIDLDRAADVTNLIKKYDAVIAATPYQVNEFIARCSGIAGVPYFDLTEDVETTKSIARLRFDYGTTFIPQCGLAPGAIGIITRDLIKDFEEIDEIKMRVGALPITTSNKMKYYLSWSSEGLVNEYYEPCPAIIDGRYERLDPLEGYETLLLDGCEYEAFNTSGGIGEWADDIRIAGSIIKKLTYKTIRYKGHRDQILFLKEDLGLTKEKMIDIFNAQVPHNEDDVVLIFSEVIGKHQGKRTRKSYFKKIYGDPGVSAIQKTTAAGIVSVVHEYFSLRHSPRAFESNEGLLYSDFIANKYGAIYA